LETETSRGAAIEGAEIDRILVNRQSGDVGRSGSGVDIAQTPDGVAVIAVKLVTGNRTGSCKQEEIIVDREQVRRRVRASGMDVGNACQRQPIVAPQFQAGCRIGGGEINRTVENSEIR